jgi:hypothetical protein
MPMFNPQTEYDVIPKNFPIRDFHDYKEEFVVRPPYQRKNVWSTRKQQSLLDSLFRRYYVPKIVIREVRLNDDRTVSEVIDGQQRIYTVQRFLDDDLPLPKSLRDIHPELAGARYSELSSDVRRFIDRELVYDADLVKGIDDPRNPKHQEIATEIFWRLQQGESLNYMEIAHSRLSSLARNFVVKYADDQQFDFEHYVPIDSNPDKHRFFEVIDRNNDRMQHLALLTRLLLIEESDGPADIKDMNVMDYIDKWQQSNGIGNYSLEKEPHARQALRTMNIFFDVFKDDPMISQNGGMKEFRIEYFIISVYLLLRHLLKYYVFDAAEHRLFYGFVLRFHERWRAGKRETDTDILVFSDNRQQTTAETEVRDRIMRQAFFEYAQTKAHQMLTKDERRVFDEADRILIYRMDNGLCQQCLAEGKPEREARVSWKEYQADHVVPHSKGGRTVIENAQVLCRYHNAAKGNKLQV